MKQKHSHFSVWTLVIAALVTSASMILWQPRAEAADLSSGGKSFVNKAAEGGMMEVQMGKLAAKNASDADVKHMGEMLVSDHQKANDELKAIASKKGIELPTDLGPLQKTKLGSLEKKQGHDFDLAFTKEAVKDHEKDVAMFEDAAKDLEDPELKAFAQKTLPVLKEHLAMAKKIEARFDADKKTDSAGNKGSGARKTDSSTEAGQPQ